MDNFSNTRELKIVKRPRGRPKGSVKRVVGTKELKIVKRPRGRPKGSVKRVVGCMFMNCSGIGFESKDYFELTNVTDFFEYFEAFVLVRFNSFT